MRRPRDPYQKRRTYSSILSRKDTADVRAHLQSTGVPQKPKLPKTKGENNQNKKSSGAAWERSPFRGNSYSGTLLFHAIVRSVVLLGLFFCFCFFLIVVGSFVAFGFVRCGRVRACFSVNIDSVCVSNIYTRVRSSVSQRLHCLSERAL